MYDFSISVRIYIINEYTYHHDNNILSYKKYKGRISKFSQQTLYKLNEV